MSGGGLTPRTRRSFLLASGLGLAGLIGSCGNEPPAPAPPQVVASTPTPAPTATPLPTPTPTLTPRPAPAGVMEIVLKESAVDRSNLCTALTNDELARAERFQLTMPFDEPACRSLERFFDIRQVEQGAGVFVPAHTARLQPGARIVAPGAGFISVREMQQDTPPGLHLYGPGALWIRIEPTDPTGRSVPHSPVVHLYVPGDSTLAAEFTHLPRQTELLRVDRRAIIVDSLGETLLDPERTHNHNLVMFLEIGQGFVELFSEGAEMFLASGEPRI